MLSTDMLLPPLMFWVKLRWRRIGSHCHGIVAGRSHGEGSSWLAIAPLVAVRPGTAAGLGSDLCAAVATEWNKINKLIINRLRFYSQTVSA